MSRSSTFIFLFIFALNLLHAQSEEIKLIETKTEWRETSGLKKLVRVNYNYEFKVGDGKVQKIGKNASNLEKYITGKVALRKFNECVKQTKIANSGSTLSFVGGAIMGVGLISAARNADPLSNDGPNFLNGFTIAGIATAVIGLNMRVIFQNKARASLKKSVYYQNADNANSGLILNLQHSNLAYNPQTKTPQFTLKFNF